jgi:DNA polymerase-3 subunit epsilon
MRLSLRRRSATTPAASAYARATLDRGRTPWRLASFCVVDLELSGLDPKTDEVISFAAVPVDGGRVVVGGSVTGLIRPTRPLVESSVLIHGLRTADLGDAPELDEAIQPLLAALTGRILVAHESWVESAFLSRALARQGVRLRGPVIDTFQVARLHAGISGRGEAPRALGDLVASLGLPSHRPHDALGDALTTAQLFVALATMLDATTRETVASLAGARRRASFEVR